MKQSKFTVIGLFCICIFGLGQCVDASGDTTLETDMNPLTNTNWELLGGEISFYDNDSYHVYLGCNQINGQYQHSGETVLIIPGVMTTMGCPNDHLENQFIIDFNGLLSISEHNNGILLSRDNIEFILN